ncbi:caspase domain-containing protein [Mycena metata]|uniref:Caspase domain-containing protein n=1 Tax=Mycena metata TaxID=1033252 RepID=A0AAD7I025_9AGAR|nr:caspase domain-containing protein [Mycena metata]
MVQKKALLIGISGSSTRIQNSTFGEYAECETAHSDVHKMRRMLLDVCDYAEPQITVLIDDEIEGHVQPTHDNILRAISDFVRDVKEGDHLFFHYVGHSTLVDNPHSRSNSEEDGRDECLVPSDGEENNIELHTSLVKPLPYGSHLVAILDTSHAGFWGDLKKRGRRNLVVRRGARIPTLSQNDISRLPLTDQEDAIPSKSWILSQEIERCESPVPYNLNPPALRNPRRSVIDEPPVASPPSSRAQTPLSPPPSRATGLSYMRDGVVMSLLERVQSLSRAVPRADNEPLMDRDSKADVISLSHRTADWEGTNVVSMSSLFVNVMREDPNGTWRDVLLRISRMAFSLASVRGTLKARGQGSISGLVQNIAQLDHGRQSVPSLVIGDSPLRSSLARYPTFPLATTSSVARRLSAYIAGLRQKLNEMRKVIKYDGSFQSPELTTLHPLDLDRPVRL